MKYTPKELKGNVNVSHNSPVKEFFVLLSGILGLMLIVYIALGLAIDTAASRLPVEIEQRLGSLYSGLYDNIEESEAGKELQAMLDELVKNVSENEKLLLQDIQYRVHLVQNPLVNAMALPGGNIIMFSGLIKESESENELAFVLAHELGHFANRDHLRGLGRRLVLLAASAALLGGDSSATNFIMNSLLTVEMKFSQRQETMADLWALDLLNKRYGHVAGAEDFFKKLSKQEKAGRISYYFATHPYPDDRIKKLGNRIEEKGYERKEKTHLVRALQNVQ